MASESSIRDEVVKRLYQVPPEQFVAERTRLVKESKDAGERDQAAALGRLRRPAAPAWALARIAADDPDAVDELLAANSRLRDAMAGGGRVGGERFRQASDERLRVVARLTDRAGKVLEEAGISAGRPVLERIETTLMATATDDAGADLLRRGVLDHDLAAGGFADLLGGAESTVSESPPGGAGAKKDADGAVSRKRRERLEREARERQDEARAAEDAAAAAERDAQVAQRAAEAAVKAASVKRKDAERLAKDASRAHERARTAVDRLEAES